MPKQEIQQKPESDPVVKLYRPDPIRRSRARDYSHWQQSVQVELKTDTAQRFLERNFNQTNETLQYLDYMLVILRDDAFAKPLADELGTMFASFIEDAKATVGKLEASAESTTLPFAVQATTYDNARTYEAVLLSGNSVDMLAAIVELDHLSMMIDTARGKRVISTFDRKNLLEQWVDTLTKIVRRVRTISGQVRDRNNELRKEREERQQKELEVRNRERARQDQARNKARSDGEKSETPESEPQVVQAAQEQQQSQHQPQPAEALNEENSSDKAAEKEEAGDVSPEPEAEQVSPENAGEADSAQKEEKKEEQEPGESADSETAEAVPSATSPEESSTESSSGRRTKRGSTKAVAASAVKAE